MILKISWMKTETATLPSNGNVLEILFGLELLQLWGTVKAGEEAREKDMPI